MKLAKRVIGIGVGLVVVLVIAVVVVFVSIDRIAKTGIEKGASYALAVPTTLDRADVGVFAGTFALDGLEIANPEGFKTPFFFRLDSGGVEVSLASLRSEVVTLPVLRLSDIDVYLDRAGGKSNYGTILENLKRFESDTPKGETDTPDEKEKPGKKFIVNRIEITDITTHVNLLPMGGDLTQTDVVIPEIILTDVGTAGEPVSLAEITNIITKAILASAAQVGGGIIPDDILGDLQSNLAQLNSLADSGVGMATEAVQDVVNQATEQVDEAVDQAKEQLEDAAEDLENEARNAIDQGVRGLFGGGDDKEDDDTDDGGG